MNDILSAAREFLKHTDGIDRAAFMADLKTQRAVELLIVIIGEAAGRVSKETQSKLQDLPWAQIVRMRNRLVHHYFKIDLDLVWDVVSNDLAPLILGIEALQSGTV